MQQENFQSGQKILKQDLARAQSTKEQSIEDRGTDNYIVGISPDLLNSMAFVVGTTTTSITVRTGVGYNSTGERITISSESITYSSTNPTTTTADGIGGTTLTPQSTGSKDIPLTTGVVNLIYIQYLAITDSLIFSLHKVTGKKLFTRIDDGYEIRVVNAGAVVPSTIDISASAPGTGGPWLFLGLVDFRVGTTVASSMFDTSSRPLFQLNPNRVVGTTPQTDFSDITPSGNYGFNKKVNFDQHVKAIGSTTPTARNPHGLTLQDLGFSGKTVEQHEKYLHSSGIVNGDQTANIGTSLNLKVNPRCPDVDEVLIYGLTSSQFLVVQDVTLSSDDLVTTTFSFVSQSTGTYYFWANSITRTLEFGTTAPVLSETNKFLLWTINFNTTKGVSTIDSNHFLVPPSGPCVGLSNFTTLVDSRYFGNLDGDNLKRDSATDTVVINHNVEVNDSINTTTLTTTTLTTDRLLVQTGLLSNFLIALKGRPSVAFTSTSALNITLSGTNYPVSTGSSGAGGLDTGSWTTTSWYAIHLIFSEDLSSIAGMFSLSGTTPVLPTGYTRAKRLGWVRSDSSTTFRRFNQTGDWWWYHTATDDEITVTAGTLTLTSYLPPTSQLFSYMLHWTGNSDVTRSVQYTTTGSSNTITVSAYHNTGAGGNGRMYTTGIFMASTGQQIDVADNTTNEMTIMGYYDPV